MLTFFVVFTLFAQSFVSRSTGTVSPPAPSSGQKSVVPNDPYFQNQISFYHPGGRIALDTHSHEPSKKEFVVEPGITLDITRAWAITTGSKSVVVAILDDGFFYDHEDLKDNIWHNPGETGLDARGYRKESNGIDDDGNGFVDDVMGWDFVFNDPDPDAYVYDGMDRSSIAPYWHSVSAMGIIGAKGNNGIGVAGINWNVSMMLLKIGAQGIPRGEVDDKRVDRAIRAIRYAADNGAKIINWSGSVPETRPEKLAALREAIEYAGKKNVLLVVAAGNDGLEIDKDANCLYAPCFATDNMLVVAEVDFTGKLYRYVTGGQTRGSNWGVKRVDIGAIGDNYSTFLKNNVSVYAVSGGTSNAAPVVAGVAALVLSVNPNLTATELKKVILDSATPVEALKGKVRCGGVVNAYRAVKLARSR
jgi:subtilisin family serine protease